jgi:putative MATE family efflux protein
LSKRFDPITGKVVPVFFHYAIPSMIGMLAATSAGVIDGIFIGNFVGSAALAAVNISMPAFYLFAAVVFMLAVGGSVMCGKFMGENDHEAASAIFSKILYAVLTVSGLIVAVSLFFLDEVVVLLGANQELHGMVRDYIQIILWAAPLLIIGLTLDYFVRVDGRPVLASFALVMFAASNIFLDWLFVVVWGWGIKGAALATALSEAVILLILASHLFSAKCSLKLVSVPPRWRDGWDSAFKAAFNGFSEFANEMSLALITLLFNWVMITRLGVDGVAAFTIIGYLLMIGLEVCYGISDSLQPTVSKNLGARQPLRIVQFTVTAVISSFCIGLIVSTLFLLYPEALISIFLSEGETSTEVIALSFIAVFWPAFLFNGVNITLASYFTAMHKPLQSAAIAVSRSLVLPAIGLLLLPVWLGDTGIFIAVPIAEALTLIIALILVILNRPSRIVAALEPNQVKHTKL